MKNSFETWAIASLVLALLFIPSIYVLGLILKDLSP